MTCICYIMLITVSSQLVELVVFDAEMADLWCLGIRWGWIIQTSGLLSGEIVTASSIAVNVMLRYEMRQRLYFRLSMRASAVTSH